MLKAAGLATRHKSRCRLLLKTAKSSLHGLYRPPSANRFDNDDCRFQECKGNGFVPICSGSLQLKYHRGTFTTI